MPPDPRLRIPVMCLTGDAAGIPPAAQAGRLCTAGARWIQLRMKGAAHSRWLAEARAAVDACRGHGAILIVNDSVAVALESGADGVHLGGNDGDWAEARRALGPDRILGGTVNSADDARRAVASGCLDYVGIGPLRFTATKVNLAPVLGLGGIRGLIAGLRGLPAWAIGGVTPADVRGLQGAGAAGVAVSSYLYRGGHIEENLSEFLRAWPAESVPSPEPASLP
jgi:thiamine-phosphate pyrophosphorylase